MVLKISVLPSHYFVIVLAFIASDSYSTGCQCIDSSVDWSLHIRLLKLSHTWKLDTVILMNLKLSFYFILV